MERQIKSWEDHIDFFMNLLLLQRKKKLKKTQFNHYYRGETNKSWWKVKIFCKLEHYYGGKVNKKLRKTYFFLQIHHCYEKTNKQFCEFDHFYSGKTNEKLRKTQGFFMNSSITTEEGQIESLEKHIDF